MVKLFDTYTEDTMHKHLNRLVMKGPRPIRKKSFELVEFSIR